jgi:serine/threonine protein kinase
MWAMGCILGEMIIKNTLFAFDNDVVQSKKIFEVFGTDKEKDTSVFKDIKEFNKFKSIKGTGLKKYMEENYNGKIDNDLFDLLSKLLVLDPSKRLSAKEALEHKVFKNANDKINI